MPGEVKFNSYGIPYVVEFANVSIWPRPPMRWADSASAVPGKALSPLTRSNTMPNPQTNKPLPSLPGEKRGRSKSLKIFRTKTSALGVEEEREEEAPSRRPAVRRNTSTLTMGAPYTAHRHAKVFDIPTPPPSSSAVSSLQSTLVDLHFDPEIEGDLEAPDTDAVADPLSTPTGSDFHLRSGGLFVELPPISHPSSSSATPLPPTPDIAHERKLHKISRKIAKAVLAAGMDTPASKNAQTQSHEQSAGSAKGKGEALFAGTYGQVRAAFRSAGLVTTPCEGDGLVDATRLGAVFVANRNDHGTVVFSTIVLWG
ncbi:hypothetical protein FA95DRAFT_1593816 [Auriscalpium vulgare]|uniref:Uncharacterized protein n=1 Tax=Auriscalpium vulgare TaxID=40419 RepID=A0ACB8S2N0_9AGAM|nr:hypothetical protein FA95DRAFT_1593816 [Auriscalpium vulgare]